MSKVSYRNQRHLTLLIRSLGTFGRFLPSQTQIGLFLPHSCRTMEYTWSVEAYAKVVFHAAQYLTHPLTGLLLGYSSNNSTKIVDSIPLFHTPIVTSSIELALLQVRTLLRALY